MLGRGKLLDPGGARCRAPRSQRLYREDPGALVAYNREDARSCSSCSRHEGLLELAIERSQLSGMQLDRVGASIASFDLLYLPELRRRGAWRPACGASASSEPMHGGALLEPRPGLYRDVAVFDFKSLYPSLIRTLRARPARPRAARGDDAIEAPNGARFSRSEAILPGVIERFLARARGGEGAAATATPTRRSRS